jgi:hypothetical protein
MDTTREFTAAQIECIDTYRDINVVHDWWEFTYEQFVEDMKFADLPIKTQTRRGNRRDGTPYSIEEPLISFETYPAWACFDTHTITLGDLARYGSTLDEVEAHWMNDCSNRELDGWRKEIVDFLRDFLGKFQKYQLDAAAMEQLDNMTFRMATQSYRNCMSIEVDDQGYDDGENELFSKDCEGLDDWIEGCFRDIAHELAKFLEEEYDHQTSDEAVWDTIEANDLFEGEPDEDEEDDDGEDAGD